MFMEHYKKWALRKVWKVAVVGGGDESTVLIYFLPQLRAKESLTTIQRKEGEGRGDVAFNIEHFTTTLKLKEEIAEKKIK